MNMKDLIPWSRAESKTPAVYRDADPFMAPHREVNRLFDDVFRGFDQFGMGRFPSLAASRANWGWPTVEVSETDKEIRVTAELPGLEEQDVEVTLDDDVLTLRGEKRSETDDKERQFTERFYGQFERRIPLSVEVEDDKVDAHFKNGVLTITMPKTERAQSKTKRIAINGKIGGLAAPGVCARRVLRGRRMEWSGRKEQQSQATVRQLADSPTQKPRSPHQRRTLVFRPSSGATT